MGIAKRRKGKLNLLLVAILGITLVVLITNVVQMDMNVELLASPTNVSSILEETITSRPTKKLKYFDCSNIHNLVIVKELGKGKQKTVFEVILPTGEHVAAKRCSNLQCEKHKLIMYEDFFYRNLYEAFDKKALAYHGFCSFNSQDPQSYDPKIMTMGSTLLIEIGTPVLGKWDGWESKEKVIRPKSNYDIESLRDIARQYDAFPGGPLLMSGDNIYAHQYMRNKAGKLCHIDFDMVEQMPPPVNSTLEQNCAVMLGGFAKLDKGDSRLNCSSGYMDQNNTRSNKATKKELPPSTVPPHPHSINQGHQPFIISPLPTNMVLVHLGKTAGSTLSKNLRHGCHMFVPHPCRGSGKKNFGTNGGDGEESRVSQLTKGYYHFVPVPVDKHDGYIISSRNPIDRAVSAFLYVHPSNVAFTTKHRAQFLNKNRGKENKFVEEYDQFFECFPNVSALAINLVGDGDCAKLGQYILKGSGTSTMESEMLNHFGYGYKFYASDLLVTGSRIFTLRQEHLATDWINFNIRLGGAPHEMSGASKAFKEKLAVKLPPGGLSKEERLGLCVALADEIKVYLGVIEAADNLTDEEKDESRQEIREGCSL